MREVSAGQFRRLAGPELAVRTEQVLENPDWGAALYRSDVAKFVVSFGNRFTDVPGKYPPSHWGDSVLDAYVKPEPVKQEMVSPVLRHLRDPDRLPQIAAPPRSPARTVFPEFPSGR